MGERAYCRLKPPNLRLFEPQALASDSVEQSVFLQIPDAIAFGSRFSDKAKGKSLLQTWKNKSRLIAEHTMFRLQ